MKLYHPTNEQRNKRNYEFTKKLYYDLILHFLKKKDYKSAESLEKSWREVEEQYAELPVWDKNT